MRGIHVIVIGLILLAPVFAVAAGSGVGSSVSGVEAPARSPEQQAVSKYNAGLKHKQRALSYEAKAARAARPQDRDKQLKKARDQFEDAVEDYRAAIEQDAKMVPALNELGFAYRKLGDYDQALSAYDAALTIEPAFAPAIEYRAEAYLALGRYEDTKAAYLELYREDQDHAALLMQALDEWRGQRGEDTAAESEAFAAWIEERKRIAEVTQIRPGTLDRTW